MITTAGVLTLSLAGSLAFAAGWLLHSPAAAPLTGAAGVLAGWAWRRRAMAPALAGAVKGALAVAVIGPGLDWLISGTPPLARLPLALIAGGLVGAALGIRNYRPPKTPPPNADRGTG